MYSLIGVDGNAYSIMGYVKNAMEANGYSQGAVEDYIKDATSSDYDHLLKVSYRQIDMINEQLID